MARLKDMLGSLMKDPPDAEIRGLCTDSREVTPGALFVALRGANFDARIAIGDAVRKGAAAVLYEDAGDGFVPPETGVPCVGAADLALKLAPVASVFYGCPSAELDLIGVTGTNGKTTVTHLIAGWLSALGKKTGLLGTLGTGFYGNLRPSPNTTLAATDLERVLRGLRNEGAEAAVMEVSSHGLALNRVSGLRFKIAAFTNLSRDHLDFHGTMENYAAAKFRLFESVDSRNCVVNAHDPVGRDFLAKLPGALAYGAAPIGGERTLFAEKTDYLPHGIRIAVGGSYGRAELTVPLIGGFNAENALCAMGALLVYGADLGELAATAGALRAVRGRMECFRTPGKPMIVVDYAHTPDGLEKALEAVKEHRFGKVTCVCGCGGDRDAGKRPVMAEIACRLADHVVFTNDNPRTEDPDRIIAMMLEGARGYGNYAVEKDRRAATAAAFAALGPGDVLLVAGKGHEDYQIVGKTRRHYSDREVAAELTGAELH